MSLPNELRRHIPPVHALLATPALQAALQQIPRWAIVQEARGLVDEIREGTIAVVTDPVAKEQWYQMLGVEICARSQKTCQYSLQPVINATGVVLHTNMGRALLAPKAAEHMHMVATQYTNLELDLTSGERGSRYDHVSQLLCELVGAEDAIVVNNNAAAVVLCLSELAGGQGQNSEVVISRGELVEIGGSFRIPDIMELSGCTLKEIGTTNRCHLRDYENAVCDNTALLLKVHTSNYRVIGFTKSVSIAELAPLAKAHNLPILHDLGAGSLVDLTAYGLPPEPTVQQALKEGADVVTFSGDKLLGGPQIGVIAGRRQYITRLKKNQLLRALRVDKLTLAAFEATLRIYRDSENPSGDIPGLAMLAMSAETLRARSEIFAEQLRNQSPQSQIRIIPGQSQVGAGSAPGAGLDTFVVAITPAARSIAKVEAALRTMSPAVMVRVSEGEILVDLRTVATGQEAPLIQCLAVLC